MLLVVVAVMLLKVVPSLIPSLDFGQAGIRGCGTLGEGRQTMTMEVEHQPSEQHVVEEIVEDLEFGS